MREAVAVEDYRGRDGDDIRSGGGVAPRFQLWPYARLESGEWSVPDVILAGVWAKMCESGKATRLFYNGTVTSLDAWIAWLKDPSNVVLMIADAVNKDIACVAWLNNAKEGTAQVHFCMLGLPRAEIGRMALRYWESLGPLYVIVGVTPESYRDAIRYAEKIGFVKKGSISNLCNMVYEGRREAAVITEYIPARRA